MIHGWSALGGLTMTEWENELERWLKPFLDRLGHKTRQRMCPLYVAGLIGPGDRKSVQPMAERLATSSYDQLHHFIADGVWDATPLETELLNQADRLVGGRNACSLLMTPLCRRRGSARLVLRLNTRRLSAKRQIAKRWCLTLARGEVPVMVALRLFLPDSWTSDVSRLKRARVPVEHRTPRSKPEIALAEIDRAMAANVRFGCVLADAGYGLSAPFRQGLTERGLAWAVGIPRHLKVYPVDVKLIWPITKVRGKPRKHHVPDILSIAAEQMLASAKWKAVSWRSGTKGRLKARFAALRVRTADGPPQRIWDKGQQHLPGDEAWLIGEQRASGEKKYYLANLPATTDLRTLAATIKARWICEQAHQQLKEELGLDHFEGRSWQGLHRHALMTMIAYAFLQHRRLAHAGRKKKNQRASASANHARRTSRHRRSHPSAAASTVSILPKTNP